MSTGNDSIIKELIHIIIETSENFLQSLNAYYASNNWEEMKKAVHSYSSQIGMLKPKSNIISKMDKLEFLCSEQNNKQEVKVIITNLEFEIQKIIVPLTAEFGKKQKE